MIDYLKPYPAMKDSGAPWLGEVPEHWEVQPIGRIGQLFKGNGGNKGDEVPSGIPCVRYGDLYTRHEFVIRDTKACLSSEKAAEYTRILHGDVLFAASGETIEDIGRSAVNLIGSEARCGGDILILRPAAEAIPQFLGYAADSTASRNQKACMGRGFTVVHIYGSQLKRLMLPLPPLLEQAAIVRFLDHVDRRIQRYIRAKQKLIKLLAEQKQAIIHRAVTRGLDPNVRLKPSGVEWLGEVPEHWEVKPLKFFVPQVTVGIVVQPARLYVDGGVPCLRSFNISSGAIRAEDLVFISPESNAAHRKSQIFAGDLVVVRTGQAGVAAIVTPDFDGANCIDLLIVRASAGLVSEYLLEYLNSWPARTDVQYRSVGAIQSHYNTATLANSIVPAPPTEEQRKILRYIRAEVAPVDESIRIADREISLLREYRTRLIADIVTGKLDVREAAARLPDEDDEPEPLDEAEALSDADEDTADDLEAVLLEETEA